MFINPTTSIGSFTCSGMNYFAIFILVKRSFQSIFGTLNYPPELDVLLCVYFYMAELSGYLKNPHVLLKFLKCLNLSDKNVNSSVVHLIFFPSYLLFSHFSLFFWENAKHTTWRHDRAPDDCLSCLYI